MINELRVWAHANGLTAIQLSELLMILTGPPALGADTTGRSEAAGQSEIMLEAPRWGGVLYRNNVGVWIDETGVPVRYGLANTSARLNRHVKSSDLIGFVPVGGVAVFTAIECKRADWVWSGSAREVAQQRFHNIVKAGGGIAGFCRNAEDFRRLISG